LFASNSRRRIFAYQLQLSREGKERMADIKGHRQRGVEEGGEQLNPLKGRDERNANTFPSKGVSSSKRFVKVVTK